MNAQDVGGREKRVLVVDDCVDTTKMMRLLLRYRGYSVRTAHDGTEALRVAEEFTPTAILLDLSLPDMTGEDVAAQLRRNQTLADALIVAISGYGDEGVPAGFDRRLVKPVDHDALLKMLSDQTPTTRQTGSVDDQGSEIARPSPSANMVRV
jgi:CheY-like chemotaxis protein